MDRDGPHDPDEKRPAAGPSGARESRSKTGHTETGTAVKIQSDTTTTFTSVLYINNDKYSKDS